MTIKAPTALSALLVLLVAPTAAALGDVDPIFFLREGTSQRQAGDLDDAIRTFRQGLAAHPEHADLLVELAVTLSWADRWEEALAIYDRAIASERDHRGALLGRARLLSWMSRPRESMEAYQSYMGANPNDPDALLGIADLHLTTSRVRKARRIYEALREVRPEQAEAGLKRADAVSKVRVDAAVSPSASRNGSAPPGVAASLKWAHRSRVDFWGSYALEQNVQPGELGSTRAADERLHRAELGTSFAIANRVRMAVSPGVAVDASGDFVHALGLNASVKLGKLVLLGAVRPQIDSGRKLGVLTSVGAQWLFAPESFLMGQAFRFDGAGIPATALVATVRSRVHRKLTLGGSVGISVERKQERFPLGGEIEFHSSRTIGWFARYDWFGSGPRHRVYLGIRWTP